MTRKEMPYDLEPLDSNDEFFVALCDLVDEYVKKEDATREEYLHHVEYWLQDWFDTLAITGALWRSPEGDDIEDLYMY